MIVVFQRQGRGETPENIVLPTMVMANYQSEEDFLLALQNMLKQHCWNTEHNDTKFSYRYDIEKYPAPAVLNIIYLN